MDRSSDRRDFLKRTTYMGTTVALGFAATTPMRAVPVPLFKISLAQWSLHRTIFGSKLDNLDFARIANQLGIDAVEYVNQFFQDKVTDTVYLAKIKKRAAGQGVQKPLDHDRQRGTSRKP